VNRFQPANHLKRDNNPGGFIMHHAYGYSRVSTAEQKRSDLGIAAQRQAIEAHFENQLKPKGFRWGGHFQDPAVSGSTPFLDRKAGSALGYALKKGDVILIHKIDRGFRSIQDLLTTMKYLADQGVTIYFVRENLTTGDDAIGRLMLQILTAFAEFERELAASRTREAMAILKARGQPLNHQQLIGFEWYGRKGHKKVKRDEHDRKVMFAIVKFREMGLSWNEIVEFIASKKVLTSQARKWEKTRVRRAYCAELYLRRIEAAGRRAEDDPAELFAYRNFCSKYVGRTCRVRDVEKMLTQNWVDAAKAVNDS
jgi:DNA invertase Pin-like site-specific DNA recombinase